MPQSTSTIPSSAASAQALQCGTPGQGSGSRSRQTPGSTRSPRPAPSAASACARRDGTLRMAPTPDAPIARRRRAMGKRGRRRRRQEALARPSRATPAPAGDVLVLRGAMSPATRRAVRRGAPRGSPLPRGRLAARGRVPVRAPGGALGDRRHGADHAPEGAARPLPLRLGRRAALDPRRAARAPRRALPRAGPRRDGSDPGRLRAAPVRLLPRRAARPAGRRALDHAGRAAAAGGPARAARARGVAAAADRAARRRPRSGGPPRATPTSTPSRPPSWPRRRAPTRRSSSRRPRTRARWPASTPRPHGARRPRAPRRCARPALRRRWCGTFWPTPAGAQQAGMGTAEFAALRPPRDVPRPATTPSPPGRELSRAARPRLIDRLAGARELHIEAEGTDLRLARRRAARGSTPTAGATCPPARSSRARIEDSAEGRIRVTIPSSPRGVAVDGRRAGASARAASSTPAPSVGEEYLLATLDTDPGARRLGELGHRHQRRHRPAGRARSCSTRRSAARSTSRSAARIPRRAARTSSAVHWDLIVRPARAAAG